MNRGKRSITVDLKKPGGVALIHRLAKVLRRGPQRTTVPACSTGWGSASTTCSRTIPKSFCAGEFVGTERALGEAAEPRHAGAGGQRADGENRDAEDPPLAAGIAVADHSGALSLAAGVLGALFARERTGKGQRVDASIFGTLIAMQGFELDFVSMSGRDSLRAGRGHQFLHGVWGAYRTSDGWICIAGVDDKRWPDFCRVMGIQHLQDDPQFDNPTRNFHGWKMIEVLDTIFPKKTTRQWLDELTAVDILVTEVADYRMLLDNEQARVNGYLQELDHPIAGRVLVSGTPITYNGEVRTESPPRRRWDSIQRKSSSSSVTRREEIAALRDEGRSVKPYVVGTCIARSQHWTASSARPKNRGGIAGAQSKTAIRDRPLWAKTH